MGRYIVRRLIFSIPLLIGVSLILYFLMRAVPGGPLAVYAQNPHLRAEDLARIKQQMGLNDPVGIAYLKWLGQILQGNLGVSIFTGLPVAQVIGDRLPNTLVLMTLSTVLSLIVGVVVGVISAIKQYSKFDYAVTTLSFFGYSMPTFWFGILMMMFFAANEYTIGPFTFGHWLPAAGMFSAGFDGGVMDLIHKGSLANWVDFGRHLVLATIVLCIVQVASWSRFARSSMLEVIRTDYVRMARAKGLAERFVIGKHALRNTLIPIVTIVALSIPGLFAGATITEQIFAWPGIGRLFIDSLGKSDYPVIMAIIFISAVLVVLSNILADILYAALDPRIRFE